MKIKSALAAAFLLGSTLAGIPVTAQNPSVTVSTKPPPALPTGAARQLRRYRKRTADLHRRYEARVTAEQARLSRALRQELLAATKRRDFAAAQALLTTLQDLQRDGQPENAKFANATEAKAQVAQALLGKWNVRCGPNFQTVWTFQRDGTVLSVNGAAQGHWQWEPENRRILLKWDATAWDSLNLPLNAKGTFGDTYHREGWRVEAVKLL